MTAEHKRIAEVQVGSVAWRRWWALPERAAVGHRARGCQKYYFYLDNVPGHYMKALYKYPQQAYSYARLVAENRRHDRHGPEYERLDTEPQLVAF